DVLSSPEATQNFLMAELSGRPHEVFACLFLDTKNRVISFNEMFNGTIDGASIYPREIAKKALKYNASAVILAHNHPSGITKPSHADITITKRLREVLELLEIRVLDHFIVGDGCYISFVEEGLI
ncbi:MAG: DNA repair protein RadC, partial [Candidatus Marithrix sp.]|nr:DNA repair protein RadC [Candidatus Marithrix sp.]